MNARETLLRLLAQHAYQYRPNNPFTLVSGERSVEYLDCKLALSFPEAMLALGTLFHNALKEDVTAIGGMTLGSDPIAMSTSLASANTSHPVKWFTVPHTTINPGELVAVVDDVVTSGKSTIKAIEACHNHGLNIVQIIVLVDRQQSNGMKNICEMAGNIPVDAIFTKEEIKSKWMKLYPNTQ